MLGRATLIVAICLGLRAPGHAQTLQSEGNDAGTASFSEVVEFVQEQGWQANLRTMCSEFGVAHLTRDCVFKQVSVQDDGEDLGGRHAFNVPANAGGDVPYILVFHLKPLIGEFFIVSSDGRLLATFYRSRGAGYNKIPNEEARRAFDRDAAYWTKNLERLKQGLGAERSRQK
jgi:hypothetical protein